MESAPHKEFVSEPVSPVPGSFGTSPLASGEPGVPLRFVWRGVEYQVTRVLETWKTTGPCRNGSGERYVRRHWFRVETADGSRMELYFDRQARTSRKFERWWLATVEEPGGGAGQDGPGEG
jgi:hypothetical protein